MSADPEVPVGLPAADDAVRIRPATAGDVELIHSFIVDLAEYERAVEKVTGTPEQLAAALFGPRPCAEAVIAELDGTAVGFALFHGTFSTWECRPGIWLEDLYVPVRHRRAGVGHALLRHLARLTVQRGCARLEWHALDWNTPALEFYAKLGAERLSDWKLHRLTGGPLRRVAGPAAVASDRRRHQAPPEIEKPRGAGLLRSRPVSRILSRAVIHLSGLPGPWRVTCKRSCLA